MKKANLKKVFIILLGFIFIAFNAPRLSADEETGDNIDMVAGDIQTLAVKNLTRVSVTNPEVADISDAVSDKVSLLAKKAGTTVLFIWDDGGKRDIRIRVVNEDLDTVRQRVEKVIDEANIKGVSLEDNMDIGKVVLTGSISKEDKDRLSDIIEPYSDNLLNLVKEEKSEDLIEVDMQVVEINTTYEESLGIQWGNTSGTATATSTGTGTTGSSGSNSNGVQLGYGEQNIPPLNQFKDLFKIGNFQRTTPLEATVNAMVSEGKAKLISKPRLVVVSGKQASFLVGGEIPINSTTTNAASTSTTSSTSYTQYGVNMTVTPTIKDGKIDVLLNVDIRDIDGSTPISSNSSSGSNVAFITRTASTDLLMDNKQTLALAGLIKYESSVTYTEVPFLGKIPLIGALFRSKSIPGDTNTEMVIILTPTVLTSKKIADSQLVMPTPDVRAANQENDAKYEHEPLTSNWPAPTVTEPVVSKSAPVEPPVTPIVVNQHVDVPSLPEPHQEDALTAYARMVQEKISKAILYPRTEMGVILSGTVKLKLHILNNGTLDSAEVMESSGNVVLDQDAMQAAKTAAPYDAFSTGMDQKDLIFTIPIVYNKLISKN